MAKNVLSCRVHNYGDFQAVAYSHLASLGITNVEISIPTLDEAEKTKLELKEYGLTPYSLQAICDVQSSDCAKQVADQMPVFAALGTKIMFASCKAEDTPLDTVYGRLREAGDVAAAAGVTIVMETHPDLITNGDVALQTMKGVNHPNVRVNYDTANVCFYNEGIDSVEELKKVIEYVAAVHIKDTNGKYKTWHFPAIGRGIVNFPGVFEALDAVGYTGPYTLEVEGIEGEEKSERRACDRIAESLGYLRALGRA